MAKLFTPFIQAIDANGNPISGAKLYFYVTGTTTPKNTYSDSGLTSPNTNPVIADSAGRFGAIYLATDADYKAILKDSSDVTIATRDPLLAINSSVIAHQGSLIVGNSSGADSELTISATNGARLASDGTTAVWRSPNYTVQKYLSGSGTYTTPANCTAIRVRVVGGGGGGGGVGGTTGPTGTTGGTSSFNSVNAVGGSGGVGQTSTGHSAGGAAGTGGTGTATFRMPGCTGGNGFGNATYEYGGPGGNSAFFGGGAVSAVSTSNSAGAAGGTNTGGGGSGASIGASGTAGGGGGGESFELAILAPSATYSYAVGGGGAGGVGTGANANTGGAGAAGIVIVEEFYA